MVHKRYINRTYTISNLPHNSCHYVTHFWVILNLNHCALAKNLVNDNFVDVFNVLIKAKSPIGLEDTPNFRDNDLGIEILAKKHRAYNRIK